MACSQNAARRDTFRHLWRSDLRCRRGGVWRLPRAYLTREQLGDWSNGATPYHSAAQGLFSGDALADHGLALRPGLNKLKVTARCAPCCAPPNRSKRSNSAPWPPLSRTSSRRHDPYPGSHAWHWQAAALSRAGTTPRGPLPPEPLVLTGRHPGRRPPTIGRRHWAARRRANLQLP